LKQINEEEYDATLQKLAAEKYTALEKERRPARKKKTADYLQQKGYELSLINKVIDSIS
jgi:SOS response regulatory protein OraA/RecX